MGYLKKLFKDNMYVSMSNVLITLGGVISFPIWTRLFTKEEYGILTLITTTIIFIGSFSKVGLQHAATRYYYEFIQNKRELTLSHYYSTIFISSFIFGLILSIVFALLALNNFISGNSIPENLVILTAILSFIYGMKGLLSAILLAEQKAKLWSIASTIERISQLLLSFLLVTYLFKGLYGYFVGQFLAEGMILIVLTLPFLVNKIKPQYFSSSFLFEAIKYGFPLLGFEISRTVLSLGDRYLINLFMEPGALGLYSAGYNLCMYIMGTISNPMRMTVVPMFLEIWEKEGKAKTEEFLKKVLNYYSLITVPIFFGLNILKEDIMTFVASSKYKDAHFLIPYISFALLIYGTYFIFGAGLYIDKKTKELFYIVFISAVLNIFLNFFLIPAYGLTGAAISTLLSYLVFTIVTIKYSYPIVKVKIDFTSLSKYIFISLVMMITVSIPGINQIHVLARIVLGAIVYCVGLLLIDSTIRQSIMQMLRSVRTK